MKEKICPFKKICGAWMVKLYLGEEEFVKKNCNDNPKTWEECPHYKIRIEIMFAEKAERILRS